MQGALPRVLSERASKRIPSGLAIVQMDSMVTCATNKMMMIYYAVTILVNMVPNAFQLEKTNTCAIARRHIQTAHSMLVNIANSRLQYSVLKKVIRRGDSFA